jgi:hypothetical protein
MKAYVKILSGLFLLSAVSLVNAQQQGGGGGGPGGGGPGGGGPGGPDGGPPDPEQMRQMMDQRIKQALQPTDDAWTTLQPMIDKVTELEHQADSGPLMHGRPHRDEDQDGDHQEDDDRPQSPVEAAISKLKKVLSDKNSSEDTIKTATAAVEDAEKKVKDDLAAARKELKAAVNVRQAAVLVALGVLD